MIKKLLDFGWYVLGLPYNILKSTIMYLYVQVIRLFNNGWKLSKLILSLPLKIMAYFPKLIKNLISVFKQILLAPINISKYVYKVFPKNMGIWKWLGDIVKESIAQIFTLLGFFIAWFTLTGTAQDIVGIAIVISTVIWLLTINLRKD